MFSYIIAGVVRPLATFAQQRIRWPDALWLSLGAVPGAAGGAIAFTRISPRVTETVLYVVVLCVALFTLHDFRMQLKKQRKEREVKASHSSDNIEQGPARAEPTGASLVGKEDVASVGNGSDWLRTVSSSAPQDADGTQQVQPATAVGNEVEVVVGGTALAAENPDERDGPIEEVAKDPPLADSSITREGEGQTQAKEQMQSKAPRRDAAAETAPPGANEGGTEASEAQPDATGADASDPWISTTMR